MIQNSDIRYGDIVWVDFDPSVGHEYKKTRPAVVIQADEQTQKSNLVTIIPITTAVDKKTTDDILINRDNNNRLFADSVIKVHCITSFDYTRMVKVIGRADNFIMAKIKVYLKKHFGL